MKRSIAFFIIFALVCSSAYAQNRWKTDVTNVDTTVVRGHLKLGGVSPDGDKIVVNSHYLERNGEPIIPIFGEFHFSRYPADQWDQEIKKMKAGGITLIATYVFWSLHEPSEGHFYWDGDLDLRRFVELCGKNDMDVIVRVGPFDHGEWRNGGIPDWLYGRPIEIRSNDPEYLKYVERLYGQIGQQLKGQFHKDGGPIIGVQIENEYQHSAAPWGFTYDGAPRELTVARRDVGVTQIQVGINKSGNENSAIGAVHMKTLKKLAVDAGLIAPLYTATGWGYATIIEKESLPVMSAYAYPYWVDEPTPSPFYLYKDIHAKPDYEPVSYNPALYPSLGAELGTGMAVVYKKRPRVPQESLLPMMIREIGSGSNGLGFYMYHGGTTPSIGNQFYTEAFGLNLKSYDYQSPLGEFGFPESSFYSLKVFNYFLRDFGATLAPCMTILPKTNPTGPANVNTLRYAVRSNGESGYVFMHNFQDHIKTSNIADNRIEVKATKGTYSFPNSGTFDLNVGSVAVLPFNIDFGGVKFKTAMIQPFCKVGNGYVFVSMKGLRPEIVLEGRHKIKGTKATVKGGDTVVSLPSGKAAEFSIDGVEFLLIPFEDALNAYTVNNRLFISNGIVCGHDTHELITTSPETEITVWPAANISVNNGSITKISSAFGSKWKVSLQEIKPALEIKKTDDRHIVLDASGMKWDGVNEVYLSFDYVGDRGICMMDGVLQTDNFYTSRPWLMGLKKYTDTLKDKEMYFYFVPMQKDAPYLSYLDSVPDFGGKKEYLSLPMPKVITEYKVTLVVK